ncbi:N(6)-adenine-specific methyltransferase METTL4 [Aplysia californica]|uniref:N(6)-adenine-specific methyltransferase METTL4 n=1 Tax=Aplysia californica TaxID=6500 RepID=A0ABM0ZXF6_APLCA|nr:N(6)-adenine-specific methyltransferase METTL4 [Aplysia californica]XP_012936497.1 N(6)-adenine-specific methyltransferase METTL4 [Aplysia californica]XP_012936499.1 N(6)-adenine-specific methyltransferase METTL4 [Aplysia californica]XP_012936500.1 N(6)-adenine-specific methyltransferase METTL4 [Aplysia californica]
MAVVIKTSKWTLLDPSVLAKQQYNRVKILKRFCFHDSDCAFGGKESKVKVCGYAEAISDSASTSNNITATAESLQASDQLSGRVSPESFQYQYKDDLFAVYTPFMMNSQAESICRRTEDPGQEETTNRKRKRKTPCAAGDSGKNGKIIGAIKELLPEILERGRELTYFREEKDALRKYANNKSARLAALIPGCEDLFQNLCAQTESQQPGQTELTHACKPMLLLHDAGVKVDAATLIGRCVRNLRDCAVDFLVDDHLFLVPAKSMFLSCTFWNFIKGGYMQLTDGGGYDLIVVDPPWRNKSVKRKKSYWTFEESDLKQIPVPALANEACLVCVWVTNKDSLISCVKNDLFPAWGVELLSEWLWLKLTRCGDPVCDVDSPNKKCYEQLIIGRLTKTSDSVEKVSDSDGNVDRSLLAPSVPPYDFVLVTTPCVLHSKKPPLSEILSEYVAGDPRCLELFARNLLPGWTSWGNEPLRHQHIDYFERLSNEQASHEGKEGKLL